MRSFNEERWWWFFSQECDSLEFSFRNCFVDAIPEVLRVDDTWMLMGGKNAAMGLKYGPLLLETD